MAKELIYQSIDTPQNNPLQNTDIPLPTSSISNKNRKSKLLLILIILIIILSLTAIIRSQIRQKQINTPKLPIYIKNTTPSPGQYKNPQIPTPFQEQVLQLENRINDDFNFPPPNIDVDIGL